MLMPPLAVTGTSTLSAYQFWNVLVGGSTSRIGGFAACAGAGTARVAPAAARAAVASRDLRILLSLGDGAVAEGQPQRGDGQRGAGDGGQTGDPGHQGRTEEDQGHDAAEGAEGP